jgi:hypothetical protein
MHMVRSRANIHKSHARTAQVCCCVLKASSFRVGVIRTMQDLIPYHSGLAMHQAYNIAHQPLRSILVFCNQAGSAPQ